MTRPSPFEIMRRNRPKLARARKPLVEHINDLEREIVAEWGAQADEQLAHVQSCIDYARAELLLPRRRPSLMRRFLLATRLGRA